VILLGLAWFCSFCLGMGIIPAQFAKVALSLRKLTIYPVW
ncbi:MAG: hypothetical protein ACI8WB_004643, partial [Phenylobacterium sp.]